MEDNFVRPSTPNMVVYDHDEGVEKAKVTNTVIDDGNPKDERKSSGKSARSVASFLEPPPAVIYEPPSQQHVWTVEGNPNEDATNKNFELDSDASSDREDSVFDEEDETKILLEKEFEDAHEDGVHKSAGPVIFVSKCVGLLPVIWTDETAELENECKSYFNLYTFIIFIGWICMAAVCGLHIENKIEKFPGEFPHLYTKENKSLYPVYRFITNEAMDTYFSATWVACLITLIVGIFKSRPFAEFLFGLAEIDEQLELQRKHYEKIKRKSVHWIMFLTIMLGVHGYAFYTVLEDAKLFTVVFFLTDLAPHLVAYVLDLQYLHFCAVLCRRYKMVDKILTHITKPWTTFRDVKPPNYVLKNILQSRFDEFFDPSADFNALMNSQLEAKGNKNVDNLLPLDLLLKSPEEQTKVSKEEENTFILQLDILRGIHADLNTLAHEVDAMFGFRILVHVITSVIFVVMFGYFFSASAMEKEFYWPYLVLFLLPAIRLFMIGHWGQLLEKASKKPFHTICQVSTVDGSPRLERQVQKVTIQMHHQCPTLTAAGFFTLGRNMILKTLGVAVVFTFFMVKFRNVENQGKLMDTLPRTE